MYLRRGAQAARRSASPPSNVPEPWRSRSRTSSPASRTTRRAPTASSAAREAGGDVAMLASNESPFPPVRGGGGGGPRGRLPGSTAIRTLARGALRVGALATATTSRSRASRSETAPARSCSRRPRRCSSPAATWSMPGPPSRCIRTSRPSPDADERAGAARLRRRARPRGVCGWRSTTAPGWCSSATRTTRPAPTCRAPRSQSSWRRCRARAGHSRRGLRRVPARRGSRHHARPAPALPEPGDPAHLLEGLRARRTAGRICTRHGGLPGGGRPRAPAVLGQPARAGRGDGGVRHQDDVARRVERNAVERLWMAEQLQELGLSSADSQANFFWLALPGHDEAERGAGAAPQQAWRCAPAARSVARATPRHATARGRRTSVSSKRCARSSRRLDSGPRRPRLDAFPATCYKVLQA